MMKNLKSISKKVSGLLILFVMVISLNTQAQTAKKSKMMKDCCMMKEGKMMVMKDGKTMPMEKDMVMKDGTKCMVNGECIMKDGTKMQMKEGDCMEMSGKMCTEKMKMMPKKAVANNYNCPMHTEVTSNKAGKCSKCGMTLVAKK
jgi:Heavy metal binding domain